MPLQNEVTFSSFASWNKDWFMPFLVTFQKLAVTKGCAKDEADMKVKGRKMATNVKKWVKAHWDELQFYSLESYIMDGADIDAKYENMQFACNLAMVRYVDGTPFFYFIKDAFTEAKF